jgi:hypothetical protein
VSRSSNLRKVLEVAALRAARGVDEIDAPQGAGARCAYQPRFRSREISGVK